MGVNSLNKTVTQQHHGCDLNPGPSALEPSMLTTRLPSQQGVQNTKHKVNISNDIVRSFVMTPAYKLTAMSDGRRTFILSAIL